MEMSTTRTLPVKKQIDDCTLKSDGSRGQMFYFVKNNKINSVM